MDHDQRELLASGAIVGIFLLVQIGALALVGPFQEEGLQEVENTDDPSLSIFYLGAIILATAFMLLAIKYGGDAILRLILIFAGAYIALFVFDVLIPPVLSITVGGTAVNLLALGVAFSLGVALYAYPEWYVIDTAGIIMGVGAAALFGINFGILPAIVLLGVLAVYDAISVYRTEHMLTLASGMMDMRVPVVFVVPLSLSFTFLDDDLPETFSEESDSGDAEDADASAGKSTHEDAATSDSESTDTHTETGELDVATLNELGPEGVRELDSDRVEGVELDESEQEALDDEVLAALQERGGKRDALYIGLGDAVIPTVLVVSAAFFVDAGPTYSIAGITANVPALTAMAGTMVGLTVLLWLVKQGRAHAGLPLLNGGAIAGYLLGALAVGLSLVDAVGLGGYF